MQRQVSWLTSPSDLPAFPYLADSGIRGVLDAYSCGGSHGLGPCWVRRTVFPLMSAYPSGFGGTAAYSGILSETDICGKPFSAAACTVRDKLE